MAGHTKEIVQDFEMLSPKVRTMHKMLEVIEDATEGISGIAELAAATDHYVSLARHLLSADR